MQITMWDIKESPRRVLAVLAIVCFFLPLGQCTRAELKAGQGSMTATDVDGAKHEMNLKGGTVVFAGGQEFVPAQSMELPPKDLHAVIFDAIVLATFFWPLVMVVARARTSSRIGQRLLLWIEVAASAASLYAIRIWLGMYHEIRPAGYVAIGVFLTYFIASAGEVTIGGVGMMKEKSVFPPSG